MPNNRLKENPQMSASNTPTQRPVSASATARFAVIDDLPTPPLPEAIMRTGVCVGMDVDGAFPCAIVLARCMSAALTGGRGEAERASPPGPPTSPAPGEIIPSRGLLVRVVGAIADGTG